MAYFTVILVSFLRYSPFEKNKTEMASSYKWLVLFVMCQQEENIWGKPTFLRSDS